MKRRRSTSGLSEEDRRLWDRIRRSVTPLHTGKSAHLPSGDNDTFAVENSGSPIAENHGRKAPQRSQERPTAAAYYPPVSRKGSGSGNAVRLDDATVRKLQKGKIAVEARLDLHGMTQSRAHSALTHFLHRCAESGDRIVLVITGKGHEGEGVLRRQVPLWLSEPELRNIVGGYRRAHVSHGGEGALYVRLRRKNRRKDQPQ